MVAVVDGIVVTAEVVLPGSAVAEYIAWPDLVAAIVHRKIGFASVE